MIEKPLRQRCSVIQTNYDLSVKSRPYEPLLFAPLLVSVASWGKKKKKPNKLPLIDPPTVCLVPSWNLKVSAEDFKRGKVHPGFCEMSESWGVKSSRPRDRHLQEQH